MKVNTKTRYGLRILIELTHRYDSDKGVLQKTIAESQEISFKYMDSIIPSLKATGLIVNTGGRKSGYRLAKPPDQITLLDLYKTFNPESELIHCIGDLDSCPKARTCKARSAWGGLNEVMVQYMKLQTLSKLAGKEN